MNLDSAPSIRRLVSDRDHDGAPPTTRRMRHREERRDRVFAAAISLFVEQGFDETSMDDIAARAALARTTVFNHFPRKVVFLEEWTLRRRSRAAKSFGTAATPRRSLEDLLGGYLAALAEVNKAARVETTALMPPAVRYTGVLVDHPLIRDLADLIADSGADLAVSADPEQVGRLLALGYFSAVLRWIREEPAPFDISAELALMLETVLHGARASR